MEIKVKVKFRSSLNKEWNYLWKKYARRVFRKRSMLSIDWTRWLINNWKSVTRWLASKTVGPREAQACWKGNKRVPRGHETLINEHRLFLVKHRGTGYSKPPFYFTTMPDRTLLIGQPKHDSLRLVIFTFRSFTHVAGNHDLIKIPIVSTR